MKLPKLTKKVVREIDEEHIKFVKEENEVKMPELTEKSEQEAKKAHEDFLKQEELYKQSIEVLKGKKKVLISDLSRALSTGYSRAARVYTRLVEESFISKDGVVNTKKVCEYLGINHKSFIFLDVDGVLNSRATKDTCNGYRGIEDKKVKLLKDLVDETGALIVLVSTWKEFWYKQESEKSKQDDMATYLDMKLSKQGLTIYDKIDDDFTVDRGDAINKYLDMVKASRCVVTNFVIFDDELHDYEDAKLMYHVVRTSFENGGLNEHHIRRAKEKLL